MTTDERTGQPAAASLCHACAFVRQVHGRLGQTYLLCQSEAIPAKYPPQPVLQCVGYRPIEGPERPAETAGDL